MQPGDEPSTIAFRLILAERGVCAQNALPIVIMRFLAL
jgi:hypothetical protein